MAPPSGQQWGGNKREQMGLFAGYLAAILIVVLGAGLLIISLVRPDVFSGLRNAATDTLAPIGNAGAQARASGHGIVDTVSGYLQSGNRNAELLREVQIARVKLAEAEAVRQENARLKAMLRLSTTDPKPITSGRLIGSSSTATRRLAFLSVGRNQGVTAGMPVSSAMGLVGRVAEVGANSARVLLLTDTESIVPVRRATDDVVAFAEGRADGSLRIRLINLGINPLKVGDVFVTTGAGGMFRPGIAVAVATEITRDGAIGQLLSNPAATDFVLVEPVYEPRAAPDAAEDAAPAQPQGQAAPSTSSSAAAVE